MKAKYILALLLFVLLACDKASDKSSVRKADAQKNSTNAQNLKANIGWVHGACLAIRNDKIKPNTSIQMVVLSTPQKIVSANVIDIADSNHPCLALLSDRAEINKQDGRYFYTLDIGKESPDTMALGLLPAIAKAKNSAPIIDFDLNNDGTAEHASTCLTSEGMQFYISSSNTFDEKALWSDYYYLGYVTKPTCC